MKVRLLQLFSQCYCVCSFGGFYNKAIDGTHKERERKFILVTKENKIVFDSLYCFEGNKKIIGLLQ